MSCQSRQMLAEALDLPSIERADIVERLLSSFEFFRCKAIDELWVQEAENCIDTYEHGKLTVIPEKKVFAKIKQSKG